MKKNKLKWFYFLMSVVGLILPWIFNLEYFANSENIHFLPYLNTLTVNPATTGLTIDVYLAALVFSVWLVKESHELRIKNSFLYIIACFGLGIAFAFPLFLAVRESKIASK